MGPEFIEALAKPRSFAETSSSDEPIPLSPPEKCEAPQGSQRRLPLTFSNLMVAIVQFVRWRRFAGALNHEREKAIANPDTP